MSKAAGNVGYAKPEMIAAEIDAQAKRRPEAEVQALLLRGELVCPGCGQRHCWAQTEVRYGNLRCYMCATEIPLVWETADERRRRRQVEREGCS
jgi:hypothetical protein